MRTFALFGLGVLLAGLAANALIARTRGGSLLGWIAGTSAGNLAGAGRGRGGNAGATRYVIGVGTVTNNSGVRGEDLSQVAQLALQSAVAQRSEVALLGSDEQQRGAMQRGARARTQGHFFDATIQSVQPRGSSTRVVVSVAVSSYPGRVYEFESQSTITIAGGTGATAAAQDDAVRQAIQSAANSAVNQVLQGVP